MTIDAIAGCREKEAVTCRYNAMLNHYVKMLRIHEPVAILNMIIVENLLVIAIATKVFIGKLPEGRG